MEKELKEKMLVLQEVKRLQKKKESTAFKLMQAATIEHVAAMNAYDTFKVVPMSPSCNTITQSHCSFFSARNLLTRKRSMLSFALSF
jgi:hypothetical protein